jgi:hypothetical protein
MYLDKPMRDHTLLQAIARVNRPYENEQAEMVKPHGFVLDFVGIFDKLEKALAFDSDETMPVRTADPAKDAPLFFRRAIRRGRSVAGATVRSLRRSHAEKEQAERADLRCELVCAPS